MKNKLSIIIPCAVIIFALILPSFFNENSSTIATVIIVVPVVLILIRPIIILITSPKLTTQATVVSKDRVTKNENKPVFDGTNYTYRTIETTCYKVIFKTKTHNQLTVNMLEKPFNNLVQGDYGTLTYKEVNPHENYFIDFRRISD